MDKWKTVYNAMLTDIEICQSLPVPEINRVEMSFKIAMDYWEDIKKELELHTFPNAEAEIAFYRYTKPSFTGYVEYFTLLYLELCYAPQEDPEMQVLFWSQELNKLQKFIERHMDFIGYYRSGKTDQDTRFFLPLNEAIENAKEKIYDMGSLYATSHDHLVAELLAQEMFHEYAKRKLQQSKAATGK